MRTLPNLDKYATWVGEQLKTNQPVKPFEEWLKSRRNTPKVYSFWYQVPNDGGHIQIKTPGSDRFKAKAIADKQFQQWLFNNEERLNKAVTKSRATTGDAVAKEKTPSKKEIEEELIMAEFNAIMKAQGLSV